MATVTLPNSSAPSAYSQGPVPGIVEDQCKMIAIKHQPVTAPEDTRPLCDLEMSNLGGFGPKRIRLHPLIK